MSLSDNAPDAYNAVYSPSECPARNLQVLYISYPYSFVSIFKHNALDVNIAN